MDTVEVPFGDNAKETATLLLAAAEDLDLPVDSVTTTSSSSFMVPLEVAEKSGVDYEGKEPEEPKAKKAAAKKTAK